MDSGLLSVLLASAACALLVLCCRSSQLGHPVPCLLVACWLGTLSVCPPRDWRRPAVCPSAWPGPLSPSTALSASRYALNIGFNLQNKTIFNYFPFPWTVSAVHVVVGLVYCTIAYLLGQRKMSFGRVSGAGDAVLGRADVQGDAAQKGVLHRGCCQRRNKMARCVLCCTDWRCMQCLCKGWRNLACVARLAV